MTDECAPRVPVAFRTLGCKVNRVESEAAAAELVGRGAVLADEDDALVVVVNTCTVTAEADAKARKAVRQALKAAGKPVVVVTGCLAALDTASLEALGDRVVVEADKDALARRVAELAGLSAAPHGHPVRAGEGFRTRAMLKVEDGCDNFCTYCIVPHARGVPRAVPLAGLVAEAEELVAAGVREIVLTGINIGRYRDAQTSCRPAADFADLVRAVAATGVERVRLSSIEPQDVDDRLLTVLAETPAACPHLHVPLQSGSDALLSAMGRRYDANEYVSRIELAREALPGLALTTDVLVGFPGETQADACATLDLCERAGFSKLHVFRYSPRPGTPAAAMSGQISPAEKSARAEAVRELGDELRRRYGRSRLGGAARVLVERVSAGDGGAAPEAHGTSEDYLRVRLDGEGLSAGDVVAVRLTDDDGTTVLGQRIDRPGRGRSNV